MYPLAQPTLASSHSILPSFRGLVFCCVHCVQRSDTVTLKPLFKDSDDWVVALEAVKEMYDRSFPEVAGGPAGSERERLLCATVLFGRKLPAFLCRILVALARSKAWLAGAAAEWGLTSKTRRSRGGSKGWVDDDQWARTLNAGNSIDQHPSFVDGTGAWLEEVRRLKPVRAAKLLIAEVTADVRSDSARDAWNI